MHSNNQQTSEILKDKFNQASRYFRDAHKSIHVYAHENNATTLRPSRPASAVTVKSDSSHND